MRLERTVLTARPLKNSEQAATTPADLIPGWLALLVLILLLAVAMLGGFLIRGALVRSHTKTVTPSDLSAAELQQQLKKDPGNVENLLALGYAYQQQGKLDAALVKYDLVLRTDKKNTGALYNKGMVLMQQKKFKDAEKVLWDLLDVAPDHVLGAQALGEYYVAKKQYKSALVVLEPVIASRPEYADLQDLAGYSCEQLGIRDKAITYYRAALKYRPDDPKAHDGLDRLGAPATVK